jgi:2-(1,2-epoxy-1,2-dihydrophenyl)acetyl-CoA isomerase
MTSSLDTPVKLLRDGSVAILEFDRPAAMNALDVPTAEAFHAGCRAVAADAGLRAVVVRGSGRGFGAGGDLAAMRADPAQVADRLIENLHGGLLRLAAIDAPVIAALHGAVAGGSLSLALGCDLAIAAEGTRFNLAYGRIGASCDGSSSWHLPRIVGLRKAMEIALLSEAFDAAEAQRLGLVNRVVPAEALQAEALALAQRLAAGPTLAYGRMKRLLRASFDRDLAAQLDAEREAFIAGTRTHDFAEGLAAFFERRPAVFEGR